MSEFYIYSTAASFRVQKIRFNNVQSVPILRPRTFKLIFSPASKAPLSSHTWNPPPPQATKISRIFAENVSSPRGKKEPGVTLREKTKKKKKKTREAREEEGPSWRSVWDCAQQARQREGAGRVSLRAISIMHVSRPLSALCEGPTTLVHLSCRPPPLSGAPKEDASRFARRLDQFSCFRGFSSEASSLRLVFVYVCNGERLEVQ